MSRLSPIPVGVQALSPLSEREGRKVWVHCAANMRVSAFVYRYRTEVLGESASVAAEDLRRIWEPTGVWRAFLRFTDGNTP